MNINERVEHLSTIIAELQRELASILTELEEGEVLTKKMYLVVPSHGKVNQYAPELAKIIEKLIPSLKEPYEVVLVSYSFGEDVRKVDLKWLIDKHTVSIKGLILVEGISKLLYQNIPLEAVNFTSGDLLVIPDGFISIQMLYESSDYYFEEVDDMTVFIGTMA